MEYLISLVFIMSMAIAVCATAERWVLNGKEHQPGELDTNAPGDLTRAEVIPNPAASPKV